MLRTTDRFSSRRSLARFATRVSLGVWLGVVGCDPSNDRPDFGPLSGAKVDTIGATPDVVIRSLAAVVDSVGIIRRSLSERDGYLETRGYDVQNARPRGRDQYNPERVVVFRFWADPMPGDRTRMTSEATYHTTHDPSLDDRLTETVARPNHPGHALLLALIRATKSKIGG